MRVKVRLHDGQFQIWDNDPVDEFGQLWMSICPWCHQGPLNAGQVVCGECDAVSEDKEPVHELRFPPEWKQPDPRLGELF